ncbi:MAG: putative membrane protein [Cenarchaeum symbiont of Oopsacas minuta]|nr:putative membrane protein [Cenarchaeum symbiont of Oopsacas minuta]
MNNVYKIKIGIILVFSGFITSIVVDGYVSGISYLGELLFLIWIMSLLIIFVGYKKNNADKKDMRSDIKQYGSPLKKVNNNFSDMKFIAIMIILVILMTISLFYMFNEIKFQLGLTDEQKLSREKSYQAEISKKAEHVRQIKNERISFPITSEVYKILSDDELKDKLANHLAWYRGTDSVGDGLNDVIKNVLKRSCGISNAGMERVNGHIKSYYTIKIKEIQGVKYAEIVVFPEFERNNDEFQEFSIESLCVALTQFTFMTNLETGEINRKYGDKNAKIVLDRLM